MIIDTHCHAWSRWPYDMSVPDPETRGSVESLLYEMDSHGVDYAAVVCARIGGGPGGSGFSNDDNNEYVVNAARLHPSRLRAWIDVDCVWRNDHHSPGAAGRLREALEWSQASGFTHYVAPENDGWMRTPEAESFFDVAEQAGVIASLAVTSAWFADLSAIASRHPALPILLHHMSLPSKSIDRERDIEALLALATQPSIGVKVSGFNYNSDDSWDFPYRDSVNLFTRILQEFGPERLYWGSDFPASRDMLTYRQAIEVVKTHCAFAGDQAVAAILGGNAARLLGLSSL